MRAAYPEATHSAVSFPGCRWRRSTSSTPRTQQIPEIAAIVDNPPEWLEDWGRQIGAKLEDGLREAPSFIAFARDNGTVYHTYTVSAPDPFVAPYHSFLLNRTPNDQPDEARAWRKDEYPD